MPFETALSCEQQSASAAFVVLATTMGHQMILESKVSGKFFTTGGAFERFNFFMNFSPVLVERMSRFKSFITLGAAEISKIRMG